MTSTRRRRAVLLGFGMALGLLSATSAQAGTATVYQCVGPAGQAAPTDLLHPPAVNLASVSVQCNPRWSDWPIQLGRGTSGSYTETEHGDLIVAGPPATAIVGGRIERQMFGYAERVDTPQTWGFGYRLTTADGTLIERCGSAWAYELPPETCAATGAGLWQFPTEAIQLPAMSTPLLRIGYGCYKAGGKCERPLPGEALAIRRMTLRVADLSAPTVGSAIGPLAADQPVRTRTISINAADVGLGLYRLI